jgi:hypothetical protein
MFTQNDFMKYPLFVFIIILSVSTSKGNDSLVVNKRPGKNVVKTELIGLLFYSIKSISYERVVNDKSSMQFTYAFGEYMVGNENAKFNLENKTGSSFPDTRQKIKIKQHVQGEYRYYLSNKRTFPPNGFHIGISISFNKQSETFYSETDTYNTYGTLNTDLNQTVIAFNFGPQFLIKRIISFDINASPGVAFESGTEVSKYGSSSQFGHSNHISKTGIAISFAFRVGIAF